MFKKLILNILLVAIVVFILDFIVGKTLRHFYFTEKSGLHYRTTFSMEGTAADVLILGSSRANHHFVPEIFEDSFKTTFYNTGREDNGIFYQLALLRSALKRGYIPKIILLEFSSEFATGQAEYDKMVSLLPYYKTHPEVRDIITLKNPYEKVKLLSQIYPFNGQFLAIAMGNLELNKKRGFDNKGYLPLYNVYHGKLDSINYKSYEIDSNKIKAFKEFLTLAKNAGISTFVVHSPDFEAYKNNEGIDICNDICQAENIPFFDYSKDSSFLNHSELFNDPKHLNDSGARVFSKLLVNKIIHYKAH